MQLNILPNAATVQQYTHPAFNTAYLYFTILHQRMFITHTVSVGLSAANALGYRSWFLFADGLEHFRTWRISLVPALMPSPLLASATACHMFAVRKRAKRVNQ